MEESFCLESFFCLRWSSLLCILPHCTARLEFWLELKAIKENVEWSGFAEQHHVENLRYFSI